ncbi:MAG: glycine--tRNA ligase subunit beta [Proteobacteria bacterium]|nr:glycine--tRNA ligase subunit beta [Pseudomonadota bacterium]
MSDALARKIRRADLLVELGCEELPPKALDTIREAFYAGVEKGLVKQNLLFDPAGSRSFSTPRRLSVFFKAVATSQPDRDQERRGPELGAAFDSAGKATPAAMGFARSVGKKVSELETVKTEQGEWLYVQLQVPGKTLSQLIYPILEHAIKQLPVPKPMRWANHDFSFVRPVHWLIVLHGAEVLEGKLLGQAAGNTTRGHRVHSPGPHPIPAAADYVHVLEEACVIADHDRRRDLIRKKLLEVDENVHIDPDLLDEVNNLVEWPVAIGCTFDQEFLAVPHAALIASMQDHQKFFPVMESGNSGKISNRFIAVSNLESEHLPSVRAGYERVIRPRLADARFFLQQDMKQTLESFSDRLDQLVFQQKIGTIGDKSTRISRLSKKIAEILSIDSVHAERAAFLSKCDLMSQMVGEFPRLQGVIGHHYALASGEDPAVAEAIEEHYLPRFAGDTIPPSLVGQIVGIADRLDTLAGIFAAGLRPSGNRDPFGLRRASLGLVRILLEARLDLSLTRLLALAATELSPQLSIDQALLVDIRNFIVERARNHYREQGFSAELINAAISSDWDTLPDLDSRLRALDAFMGQEAAASLAAANKRIGNILRKSEEDISKVIDTDSFVLDEEHRLFKDITRLEKRLEPLLEDAEYAASLELLAGLRKPVDDFFDSVMVMDEDPTLRANRLALLFRLKALFDRIADLSVLS